MADYIYLLENRLSAAQQRALSLVRNAVRARDLTLFLTGGAVRDLAGGGSVRDLDITVQGEVTALRGDLETAGAVLTGEYAPAQSLFFTLPGGVRVEISSAMSVAYPKPGKPQYEPASITDDLRRRDFTANAMALSLNEGSYGLLMDPLNGVADIENRELRLVSNYGFLDDPSRLIRASRLSSRLGWQMEERTRQRYENAKEDDAIASLSNFNRSYELEEIFHEEDPLRIMRALDAEGWLKALSQQLVLGKANETALAELREKQGLLQTQGILSDHAALALPLIVAKLPPADVAALKQSFARPGFVRDIDTQEERTRELQARLISKETAVPSAAWRVLHEAEPNLVLSVFFTSKSGTVQSRIKTFLNDSPTARQRLPYGLLQEMRITPDLPVYNELLDKIFFELMDGKLQTTEELKAYMEPFSPPAPPPPVNLRRARAKKEARPSRAKVKKAAAVMEEEEQIGVAEGLMEEGTLTGSDHGTEPEVHLPLEGKVAPLAPGQPEAEVTNSTAAKVSSKPPSKKSSLAATSSTVVVAAAAPAAAVAAKLSVKPAPAPEAAVLVPHPEANEKIAKAPRSGTPADPEQPKLSKEIKVKSTGKLSSVAVSEEPAKTSSAAPGAKSGAAAKSPGELVVVPPQKPTPAPQVSVKPVASSATAKTAGTAPVTVAIKQSMAKSAATKSAAPKPVAAKPAPAKTVPPAKSVPTPISKKTPVESESAKPVAKAESKLPVKSPAKTVAKKTVAKKAVTKAAPKPATKAPAKRR